MLQMCYLFSFFTFPFYVNNFVGKMEELNKENTFLLEEATENDLKYGPNMDLNINDKKLRRWIHPSLSIYI